MELKTRDWNRPQFVPFRVAGVGVPCQLEQLFVHQELIALVELLYQARMDNAIHRSRVP
jgi:hypothetical protein